MYGWSTFVGTTIVAIGACYCGLLWLGRELV
jgi:hypothetical protein